jgi:hypothetical protein
MTKKKHETALLLVAKIGENLFLIYPSVLTNRNQKEVK